MRSTALLLCTLLLAPPVMADEATSLGSALRLAQARDWAGATAATDGQLARDIIEWQRLRAGDGKLLDYETFLSRHPDWPGLPLLQRRGEGVIGTTDQAPRITAYFRNLAPQTGAGAIELARAQMAQNRLEEAQATALRAWRTLTLTPDEQATLTRMYPDALAAEDIARADRLLWEGEAAQVQQMLPRLTPGWQALARARIALRTDAAGVDALIEAVPADLAADPGLAYERFAWRMRKGRYEDATALILAQTDLGRPAVWARYRAFLVREYQATDPDLAYRLAAAHGLTEGGSFADLEFLAGHIALRRLNRPEAALAHFRHLGDGVGTEISLSRAFYWEGRAQEAMGQPDAAMAAFEEAALQSSAYYGLLAAERLGRRTDPKWLTVTPPVDWRGAAFTQSSVFAAAQLLLAAGDVADARRFLLHLAETQDAEGLAAMAAYALEIEEPNTALGVAKQAALRGVMLPAAYYPTPAMVPDGLPVTRALALAITRRESEFNPTVVSPAGARGLMQVMPDTGRRVAASVGASGYTPGLLTSDPAFNVRMGSTYLAQMVEEFGPSVALIASAYNAGPGRPRAWIGRLGDPRDPNVDIVDWVEDIPFAETRTYVMRVVESLVIYRAKLAGVPIPVRVTDELRG
ncbi:lytic transglycosylase domain-containing protein [Falsirhodobacter halotolerans]|uniref:lytic transglycosylase domain-containing protein n=1 Tax=Falsirhodobacter halotolerans TaxID=1146892 RepID=UPI001FD2AD66|nr:lytic transglycosylase domain-containing protein [Falsirhodobacter halotolerans]MCJ8140675.1 lytic transglycosylase domain-containing protein [Falsirhodobacter halotolerans]